MADGRCQMADGKWQNAIAGSSSAVAAGWKAALREDKSSGVCVIYYIFTGLTIKHLRLNSV